MDATDRIVVLGGYGQSGSRVARGLARETSAALVIAGRDAERAGAVAAGLAAGRPANAGPVTAARLDAGDAEALAAAFAGARLVLVASSTSEHTGRVARAALDAGADYFDLQLSTPRKWQALAALRGEVEAAGRWFASDGGLVPGTPALMVRRAAAELDVLESAHVGGVVRVDWKSRRVSESTGRDLTQQLDGSRPLVFTNGTWVETFRMARRFDFGPPFGVEDCHPVHLEELSALPALHPGLREAGFFAAGYDWVTDTVTLPLASLAQRLAPRSAAHFAAPLLASSLARFAVPPFGALLALEATGTRGGLPAGFRVAVRHDDAHELIAACAVACLLQYVRGRRPAGLHAQGVIAQPREYFADLERLGAAVTLEGYIRRAS